MHEIIKIVAQYFIVLSLLGAFVVFLRIDKRLRLQFMLTLILGGALSYLLAKVGSHFYTDPRPFVQGHFTPLLAHSNDNGFPSDHTLFAATLAWVSLAYSRKIGASLLILTLLIGLSRMAAGVHHSWDILGSFAFAAIGVYTAWLIAQRLIHSPASTAR